MHLRKYKYSTILCTDEVDTSHLAGHRDLRTLRMMNGAFWDQPYQWIETGRMWMT